MSYDADCPMPDNAARVGVPQNSLGTISGALNSTFGSLEDIKTVLYRLDCTLYGSRLSQGVSPECEKATQPTGVIDNTIASVHALVALSGEIHDAIQRLENKLVGDQ